MTTLIPFISSIICHIHYIYKNKPDNLIDHIMYYNNHHHHFQVITLKQPSSPWPCYYIGITIIIIIIIIIIILNWNIHKQNYMNEHWKLIQLISYYSGLSLSRLLSISNFSLFQTKSSVPWTFVYSPSYFYLFISNFSILNFSNKNKNLGPLRLFLYLSWTFSRLRVHLHSK